MSRVITIVRCPRCRQPVYAAEQVLAGGKKCVHEGDIFCKQCYSRMFGIRGVGFGTGAGTLSMDTGESFKITQAIAERSRTPSISSASQSDQYDYNRSRHTTTASLASGITRDRPINPTASLYSRPISRKDDYHPSEEYIPVISESSNTAKFYNRYNMPNQPQNEYSTPINVQSTYDPQQHTYQQIPVYSGDRNSQSFTSSPIQPQAYASVEIPYDKRNPPSNSQHHTAF
ncbi:hypothetical protein GJ496_003125 [Pomphorhynchus laevis]|nr:hypothetical protein GJ496_003125 [Pomphorhynchus laevis]